MKRGDLRENAALFFSKATFAEMDLRKADSGLILGDFVASVNCDRVSKII
jgi:hypothetical protein